MNDLAGIDEESNDQPDGEDGQQTARRLPPISSSEQVKSGMQSLNTASSQASNSRSSEHPASDAHKLHQQIQAWLDFPQLAINGNASFSPLQPDDEIPAAAGQPHQDHPISFKLKSTSSKCKTGQLWPPPNSSGSHDEKLRGRTPWAVPSSSNRHGSGFRCNRAARYFSGITNTSRQRLDPPMASRPPSRTGHEQQPRIVRYLSRVGQRSESDQQLPIKETHPNIAPKSSSHRRQQIRQRQWTADRRPNMAADAHHGPPFVGSKKIKSGKSSPEAVNRAAPPNRTVMAASPCCRTHHLPQMNFSMQRISTTRAGPVLPSHGSITVSPHDGPPIDSSNWFPQNLA
ncbi:hypothetical protein ACLOJK_036436 [Asimina triloba]